jgi:3-isopropylmalate/(R)-2-methylmalate dehydratase small subunit
MDEQKVTGVTGRGIPLAGNDMDTDRIIPARFMKCVTFDGLGEYAFHDARFDEEGGEKEHPFNDSRFKGGSVLIVGSNFGCGSSREHAPQALMRYGIEAIIGESFAEIFRGNCSALGVPVVEVTHEEAELLRALVEDAPDTEIAIDLTAGSIAAGGYHIRFKMPEANQKVLVSGTWDTTSVLLAGKDRIEATVGRIPYLNDFRG